jgi:hypothetical protein
MPPSQLIFRAKDHPTHALMQAMLNEEGRAGHGMVVIWHMTPPSVKMMPHRLQMMPHRLPHFCERQPLF